MEASEVDTFWDDCDLVSRDAEILHGEPVLKGTRLPANTLVENVEAFMELQGMDEPAAIEATLKCFPATPGGTQTMRGLLAYQEARLHQLTS